MGWLIFASGVVASIVAAGIYARGTRIGLWVASTMARLLPADERDRYREEWHAEILASSFGPIEGRDGQHHLEAFAWSLGTVRTAVLRAAPVHLVRFIDFTVSAVLLISAGPTLMALLALSRTTLDEGPVLFRSAKLGLNGRPFGCVQIRTMLRDAGSGEVDSEARVTKCGRFLRRTGLDQLPRLLNVVRGDMSLVGPLPMSNEVLSRLEGDARRAVLSVKPGLCGLWQVTKPYDLYRKSAYFDLEEWARMEAEYAATKSFLGDLQILAKTIIALFRSPPAYSKPN